MEYFNEGIFYSYAISKGDSTTLIYNNNDFYSAISRLENHKKALHKGNHKDDRFISVCTFNTIEELKETHPEVFI